ncbi:MAG: hypothetical protein J0M04_05485 [Verrucomicrobia bacterium]|nr:hypothetical protein [Verrucomicrobiota bacterium]
MDDLSKWLTNWIAFAHEARERIQATRGSKIDPLDFQQNLARVLGKRSCMDLLYGELPTVETAIHLLSAVEWEDVGQIIVLETVALDSSILPEGIERLITEETVKHKGEQWVIHANDADPFPSNPHAHNYDSGLKLDLGTGALYRKRTHVDSVRCKDLKLLRDKIRTRPLPDLAC